MNVAAMAADSTNSLSLARLIPVRLRGMFGVGVLRRIAELCRRTSTAAAFTLEEATTVQAMMGAVAAGRVTLHDCVAHIMGRATETDLNSVSLAEKKVSLLKTSLADFTSGDLLSSENAAGVHRYLLMKALQYVQ